MLATLTIILSLQRTTIPEFFKDTGAPSSPTALLKEKFLVSLRRYGTVTLQDAYDKILSLWIISSALYQGCFGILILLILDVFNPGFQSNIQANYSN